jgi:hypothetical protein
VVKPLPGGGLSYDSKSDAGHSPATSPDIYIVWVQADFDANTASYRLGCVGSPLRGTLPEILKRPERDAGH